MIEAEAIRVKFQAKAEQDANIMKAETEKFVQTLIAEAQLKVVHVGAYCSLCFGTGSNRGMKSSLSYTCGLLNGPSIKY